MAGHRRKLTGVAALIFLFATMQATAGDPSWRLEPYTLDHAAAVARNMLVQYACEIGVSEKQFGELSIDQSGTNIMVTFPLLSKPGEDYSVAFGRDGGISESPNLPSLNLRP